MLLGVSFSHYPLIIFFLLLTMKTSANKDVRIVMDESVLQETKALV